MNTTRSMMASSISSPRKVAPAFQIQRNVCGGPGARTLDTCDVQRVRSRHLAVLPRASASDMVQAAMAVPVAAAGGALSAAACYALLGVVASQVVILASIPSLMANSMREDREITGIETAALRFAERAFDAYPYGFLVAVGTGALMGATHGLPHG